MYKPLLIFTVLFFSVGNIQSQNVDSLKYKYINQSIYRYGSVYQKGTERLSFRNLEYEFSMSDLGLDGYNKAKKYMTTSTILRIVSLASSMAALSIAANNGNRNTAYVLLGGQVVFGFAAAKYYGMSKSTMDRALWQRNKDLLFPAR